MNLSDALNPRIVWDAYADMFCDSGFWNNVKDDEDDLWLLFNLVPAAAGIHQAAEIITFLGEDPSGLSLDEQIEMVDWLSDDATTLLYQRLREDRSLPTKFGMRFGFWDHGGCWGLIVYREN